MSTVEGPLIRPILAGARMGSTNQPSKVSPYLTLISSKSKLKGEPLERG